MAETLDLRVGDGRGGVYTMPGSCSNCDWKGELILTKGREAPSHRPRSFAARCERCGCKTVGAIR